MLLVRRLTVIRAIPVELALPAEPHEEEEREKVIEFADFMLCELGLCVAKG
jgi:hypothetical protein